MKKTGVELIAIERQEQLEKHGWNKEHDRVIQHEGQLKFAALYSLGKKADLKTYGGWNMFMDKVDAKSELEKLIVAGAMIAAEIDRLNHV